MKADKEGMVEWTNKTPTEPGWYWTKDAIGRQMVVKIRHYRSTLCVDNWPISDDDIWAGPIPEPVDTSPDIVQDD